MVYFVEGLQGSGKSTMVSKLAEICTGHEVFREGDYSPTELAWCAYVDEDVCRDILGKYPELSRRLAENIFSEGGKRIVCYTKIHTDNTEFYKELERFEIYNGRIPQEDFEKIVLGRYERWNGGNQIFECSLFQNIIEDMTLFRDLPDDEIIAFFRRVKSALAGKAFRIVYLETADIPASIGVIRKERSDAAGNELWFPMLMDFFNNSPYAAARGISGETALYEHLAHRQALELRICREVFPDETKILPSKQFGGEDMINIVNK